MNDRHEPWQAGTRIAEILRCAPIDALETRILLTHVLQLSRVQLITQSERAITAQQAQDLADVFRRRINGEPIAYLVGTREFYGLSFQVTPDVLIPRPETELLVELALNNLPQKGRVLDLGTGSGAIAVAIAHARPDAFVVALDASAAALGVARANAERHGARITLLQSDWYQGLAPQIFDLMVANPPYIAAGDDHLSQGDLRFEPGDALTDHADGLSAVRAIIEGAPPYLARGGWLFIEHGYDQSAAVRELLTARHFEAVQSWPDLAGIERVSGAQKQFD